MKVTFQSTRLGPESIIDKAPICAECDQPHGRVGQRHCRACHTGYQRQWKRDQAELVRGFKRSRNVSRSTNDALSVVS